MFAGNPQASTGIASRVQQTINFSVEWRMDARSFQGWIWCTEDMWHRKLSVCGEISLTLPLYFWTFLTCCHSLQAAGQQAGSSSAAGVMEQRSLTRGGHGGKDFVYFWAVSVLTEESSVWFRWHFQGESFWVRQSVTLLYGLLMWWSLPMKAC